MLQAFADEAYSIRFEFVLEGELVAPDVGSVTYTIRDNTGVPLVGHTDVAVTTTTSTTAIDVEVPAGVNAKTLETEVRFVIVRYKVAGSTRTDTKSYRLTAWLPYQVTPDQVRGFTGLSPNELPDQAIDLVAAYLRVADDVGAQDLVDALTGGGLSSIKANDALIHRTVMDLGPSLRMRAVQTAKSDLVSQSRFARVDVDAIVSDATDRYTQYVAEQTVSNDTGTVPLILVTAPTDVITGA